MTLFLQKQEIIKKLNRLENACLKNLTDTTLLTEARFEGLMYDKIYADLMMLVKSVDLQKSSLSMNVHYCELLSFLECLAKNPRFLLDDSTHIFVSEPRLYGGNAKLNHRLHKQYQPVRKVLYDPAILGMLDSNEEFLLELIVAVAKAVAVKLRHYKKDHLPGGRY